MTSPAEVYFATNANVVIFPMTAKVVEVMRNTSGTAPGLPNTGLKSADYFIGDTEGNNKLIGQYPGNREGVKRPYRDCNCGYDNLSNPNPKCKYRKLDELREAKRRKCEDEDGGKEYYKSNSMYDITNG